MRRAVALATVLWVCGGLLPGSAAAHSLVRPGGAVVSYLSADATSLNSLRVGVSGNRIEFRDESVDGGMDPGSCTPGDIDGNGYIIQTFCPLGGVQRVRIDLGEREDTATVALPVAATVLGGPGADRVTSGAAADELSGGEGNDALDGGDGERRDVGRPGRGHADRRSGGGPDRGPRRRGRRRHVWRRRRHGGRRHARQRGGGLRERQPHRDRGAAGGRRGRQAAAARCRGADAAAARARRARVRHVERARRGERVGRARRSATSCCP